MPSKLNNFLFVVEAVEGIKKELILAGVNEKLIWLPEFDAETTPFALIDMAKTFIRQARLYAHDLREYYKHQTPEAWAKFVTIGGDLPEMIELNKRRRTLRVFFNKNRPGLMKKGVVRGLNRRSNDQADKSKGFSEQVSKCVRGPE